MIGEVLFLMLVIALFGCLAALGVLVLGAIAVYLMENAMWSLKVLFGLTLLGFFSWFLLQAGYVNVW